MRTIHVFMRGHCVGDLSDRKVRRKWLLQQNAVYAVVMRERVEPLSNIGGRCVGGEPVDCDVNADTLTGTLEVSHVCQAGIVFAHEDHA